MHLLNAGVFTVRYDNGFLRHISYGGLEVVRMIYMALRDQNWNTYQPIIENETIQQQNNSFAIKYDSYHELNGQRIFHWQVSITGGADSVISFEIHGTALHNVIKNRAGLCILHPLKETAGMPCEMFHANGDQIKKNFPVYISADNPFKDLKALRWRCRYDWFVLHFEGDEFETEDQRNWCDASYKTFCTPLSKPFPVELKAGDTVHQKVTFKPEVSLPAIPKGHEQPIEIKAFEKYATLPEIGITASTEADTISSQAIEAIKTLKLYHYRIDVNPEFPEWTVKFEKDCKNAELLNLPLEIALHVSSSDDIHRFCDQFLQIEPKTIRIILLSPYHAATHASLINEVELLRRELPKITIGAGTDYNFRELNCNPFPAQQVDFISYSIDPQEHATDDLTIIENIGAMPDTVASAKLIYGDLKPVHISSLTLKKRFNPAATVPADKILPNEKKSDARQKTGFTAAFTLGSIKALTQANASSVTCYQTVGTQGILSENGDKYPVYNVLKEIITAETTDVVHTESTKPLICEALLLQKDQSLKLILANYTSETQKVIFKKDAFTLGAYEVKAVDVK
jgi:D-apionolactonase